MMCASIEVREFVGLGVMLLAFVADTCHGKSMRKPCHEHFIYICIYIIHNIYIYMCVCVYVYVYVYVCVCVCVCVCV